MFFASCEIPSEHMESLRDLLQTLGDLTGTSWEDAFRKDMTRSALRKNGACCMAVTQGCNQGRKMSSGRTRISDKLESSQKEPGLWPEVHHQDKTVNETDDQWDGKTGWNKPQCCSFFKGHTMRIQTQQAQSRKRRCLGIWICSEARWGKKNHRACMERTDTQWDKWKKWKKPLISRPPRRTKRIRWAEGSCKTHKPHLTSGSQWWKK